MKRSNEQNRRYWLLLHLISEKVKPAGESYSADTWHIYAKTRWIGADDVRLPNGKVVPMPRSSADLDVAEFNTYMEQIEAWAAERDVYLEDLAA